MQDSCVPDPEARPNTCRGTDTPPTRRALETGLPPNATDPTKDQSPPLTIRPGGAPLSGSSQYQRESQLLPSPARGALQSGHVTRVTGRSGLPHFCRCQGRGLPHGVQVTGVALRARAPFHFLRKASLLCCILGNSVSGCCYTRLHPRQRCKHDRGQGRGSLPASSRRAADLSLQPRSCRLLARPSATPPLPAHSPSPWLSGAHGDPRSRQSAGAVRNACPAVLRPRRAGLCSLHAQGLGFLLESSVRPSASWATPLLTGTR